MAPQLRRSVCGHAQARRHPGAIGRQRLEVHAPVLLADRVGDARQAFGFEAGEEVGGQGGGILTLREGACGGARRRASHYTPRLARRGRSGGGRPGQTRLIIGSYAALQESQRQIGRGRLRARSGPYPDPLRQRPRLHL
ncbi:protein of unknown function [Cupriavidus neocaledonicus]|uniref:Uncharacterized protein n=1 Tax=Cupriavidus neocaledonicus TaxID=1040979 RepID=A0A375H8X9_9BURK|nr:hypothetical protein CBM2605_A210082 [Cupriavidus neocaledonicus]SPD47705.1 protein of unknown function [Cupriavidus neocaledonicus]